MPLPPGAGRDLQSFTPVGDSMMMFLAALEPSFTICDTAPALVSRQLSGREMSTLEHVQSLLVFSLRQGSHGWARL